MDEQQQQPPPRGLTRPAMAPAPSSAALTTTPLSEVHPQTQARLTSQPQPHLQPQSQPQPHLQPQSQLQPHLKLQPQSQSQPHLKLQSQPHADAAEGDTFAAVRQLALGLFRQRTKDLTRLAARQAHHRSLEAGLRALQSKLPALHALHAAVEGKAAKAEERADERRGLLRELRADLDGLAAAAGLLGRATDAAGRVLAAVRETTAEAGLVLGGGGPLMGLLERARQAAAGRTAHDFRLLAAELRRQAGVLREGIDEVRGGRDPPVGLQQQMREWAEGNWRMQPELAGLVCAAEGVLAAAAPRSFSPEVALDAVTFHEDFILDLIPCVDGDTTVFFKLLQERGGDDSLLRQGSQMVELYQRELQALDTKRVNLEKLCKEHGVSCEVFDPVIISRIQKDWEQFLEAYRQWICMLADTESVYQAIRAEQEILGNIESNTEREERICEDFKCRSDASDEKISCLWQELDNYATALKSGIKAMEALWGTFQGLERQSKEVGDVFSAKKASLEELQNIAIINTEAQSAVVANLQNSLQEAVNELAAAQEEESEALIRADQTEEQLKTLQSKLYHLEGMVSTPQEINKEELMALFDYVHLAAQELSKLSEIPDQAMLLGIGSESEDNAPVFDEKIIPHIFDFFSEENTENLQNNDNGNNANDVMSHALRELLISMLPKGDRLASVRPDVWKAVLGWLTNEASEARKKAKDHQNFLLNTNKEIDLLTLELSES